MHVRRAKKHHSRCSRPTWSVHEPFKILTLAHAIIAALSARRLTLNVIYNCTMLRPTPLAVLAMFAVVAVAQIDKDAPTALQADGIAVSEPFQATPPDSWRPDQDIVTAADEELEQVMEEGSQANPNPTLLDDTSDMQAEHPSRLNLVKRKNVYVAPTMKTIPTDEPQRDTVDPAFTNRNIPEHVLRDWGYKWRCESKKPEHDCNGQIITNDICASQCACVHDVGAETKGADLSSHSHPFYAYTCRGWSKCSPATVS